MLNIDKLSRTPIYEQVIEQFESLIVRGALDVDKPLPSVRTLAEQLSINPNTLQKAYAELERRGICTTSPGNGRFITRQAGELINARGLGKMTELKQLAQTLARAGAKKEELIAAVEEAFAAAGQETAR